jgi:hypothetical protein
MSTEEFIKELLEKHEQDIRELVELLEILEQNQEERKVYEFFVTSNL